MTGIDYETEIEDAAESLSEDKLGLVARLARKQLDLEAYVEQLELQLKAAKENLRKVQEQDLPQAMAEIGLSEFKLSDGSKVTIKPFYSASLVEENRAKAYEWLESHGFSSLMKTEVSVDFGRGEDKLADRASKLLQEHGFAANKDVSIHAQTLKAFVREQIEDGQELPSDLFKVYAGQKASIKLKK